jgi:hypothetical protein
MKASILSAMDDYAPKRNFIIKTCSSFPWFDDELLNPEIDDVKKAYRKLCRIKMIEYFRSKSMRSIKNSKKFWEFYSSSIV